MNLNKRELVQHVQYEPETYYAAFSAELEISLSPMWSLLAHCNTEVGGIQRFYFQQQPITAPSFLELLLLQCALDVWRLYEGSD